MNQNLFIGTCSWKYPSWEGLVYEEGSSESLLSQYAKRYRTVEVDQWFWSLGRRSVGLPDGEVVTSYAQETGDDFRFTIKAPNALTSPFAYASKSEPNQWFLDTELFYQFLAALAPLAKKIGLIILQFPYLNQSVYTDRAQFIGHLGAFARSLPDSVDVAIEIRNPVWVDRSWFEWLAEASLLPVLLSGYWMERFIPTVEAALHEGFERLCIRLHGEDRGAIEEASGGSWSAIIESKEEELASLVALLRGRGEEIYLNVNNHYEGSAPLTIERIQRLLEGV